MAVTFWYGSRDSWLTCGLTVDNASVFHPVNGWHDGLRELIRAAGLMLGRVQEAMACFQEEPGEFRWRVTRMAANRIRVRVIEFDDWGTGRPDKDGKIVFDALCGVMSFAVAIHDGSGEWLAELERTGQIEKADQLREERNRLGGILRRYDYTQSYRTRSDGEPHRSA